MMRADDVHADVKQLLRTHIRSMIQLEVLLLLHRLPERWHSAATVNDALRSSIASTRTHLEELCRTGLIECQPGDDALYRFAPSRPEDVEVVGKLAILFRDRFHSIVDLIYASRRSSALAFADAFRVKKGGKDDG